jgi:hypothetical protein
MRHGHSMRNYAKAFFAFCTLAIISACADNNTLAPTAEAPAVVAPANFARVGNVITFRVDNSQGITKKLGAHVISIPAGAICDAAASYGPTTWNNDCQPMRGSVVITATILQDSDAQPYIDFQPAMRFAPNKEVMLFLRQGRNSDKRVLSIKYCNALAYCFDESLTDASVKPFRISGTPVIGRRLKHFSGYLVAWEAACPGTVTSNGDGTFWCDDSGMARRSGYMVASGEDVSDILKDSQNDKGNKKGE